MPSTEKATRNSTEPSLLHPAVERPDPNGVRDGHTIRGGAATDGHELWNSRGARLDCVGVDVSVPGLRRLDAVRILQRRDSVGGVERRLWPGVVATY